jgi:hypothetical protein
MSGRSIHPALPSWASGRTCFMISQPEVANSEYLLFVLSNRYSLERPGISTSASGLFHPVHGGACSRAGIAHRGRPRYRTAQSIPAA